ncbi:VOC family protein [Massilia agilis]|uniref:VOC family protein n=1 Tax=Massilia agilis TaxID=1811226 RepID=A0ABT2D628_9BURK|nr:VOC family protein [Massilia agilis]MCS0806772.1 VOC family protein [Massilia agilis]
MSSIEQTTTMQVIPTLYFPGLCAEAISFYREHLGAEVLFQLTAGGAQPEYLPPGSPGKIIRAGLRIGDTVVYLSEGHHGGVPAFQGVSLALHLANQHEAARILHALGAGGSIRVPLRETAWADSFGAVTDRYGVYWTVEVQGARQRAV